MSSTYDNAQATVLKAAQAYCDLRNILGSNWQEQVPDTLEAIKLLGGKAS